MLSTLSFADLADTKPIRRNSKTVNNLVKNQRRTSFSYNELIPDLNIFTPGPGVGKYGRRSSVGLDTDITLSSNPAYSMPKAERLTPPEIKTPGHSYYPMQEKILGHYLSSDQSELTKSQKQRRTSFSSKTNIPDLNIFIESPGVAKYMIHNTIGIAPAVSIPKAQRVLNKSLKEKTPGPGHYSHQVREKVSGHYSFARPSSKTCDTVITDTPSPFDYSPEKSMALIMKSTPAARIPQARRFSNNIF